MDVLRPECDPEGDWAAVQCTGSDVCRWGDYMVRRVVIMMMVSRCVSKSTGEPIFGLSTNMTSVDMDLMHRRNRGPRVDLVVPLLKQGQRLVTSC